jgi:hypothetical protein
MIGDLPIHVLKIGNFEQDILVRENPTAGARHEITDSRPSLSCRVFIEQVDMDAKIATKVHPLKISLYLTHPSEFLISFISSIPLKVHFQNSSSNLIWSSQSPDQIFDQFGANGIKLIRTSLQMQRNKLTSWHKITE